MQVNCNTHHLIKFPGRSIDGMDPAWPRPPSKDKIDKHKYSSAYRKYSQGMLGGEGEEFNHYT